MVILNAKEQGGQNEPDATRMSSCRIEAGRYQLKKKDPNTESFRILYVEGKTCLICNTDDIENETHCGLGGNTLA